METVLTTTASKLTPTEGNPGPLYEGDLINNIKFYWPEPDFGFKHFNLLSQNAEFSTAAADRFRPWSKKAFMVAPVSTDWLGVALVLRYRDQVANNIRGKIGEDFLSQQRLGDSLPPEIYKLDLIARNMENQKWAAQIAQEYNPHLALSVPSFREGFIRSQKELFAMTLGTDYEDWTHEMFHYGPKLLLAVQHMFSFGAKSYSRLGAVEQGVSVPIRYGHPFPYMYRTGVQMDVTDVYGRPISPLDETWEDIKALVDIVGNGLRQETLAALVLQRFMYDGWMLKKDGPIKHDWAHPVVKAHYESDREMARMATLREKALDWMAEFCDWNTLHGALSNDKNRALEGFWAAEVAPRKKPIITPEQRSRMMDDFRDYLVAYLPRGGWAAHPEFSKLIVERRDPGTPKSTWSGPRPRHTLGSSGDSPLKRTPDKLFDDYAREFKALGANDNTEKPPDGNHLTVEQAVVIAARTSRKECIPPLAMPETYFYLGDPASGAMAAQWLRDNKIADVREAVDNPFRPSVTERFSEVTARAGIEIEKAMLRLMDPRNEDMFRWREQLGIGNIIGSDCAAATAGEIGKTRQAYNTERREAFAAVGGNKMAQVPYVIDADTIREDCTGIIIPAGPLLSENQHRLLIHALKVKLGLVDRAYSGGKYNMRFFYDRTGGMEPPEPLDLADIGLLLAQVPNADMDRKVPVGYRWMNLSLARYLRLLEMSPLLDVGRLNVKKDSRDAFSGAPKSSQIIDWAQVAHEDPGFLAFIHEDPVKSANIRALYDEMILKDYSWMQQKFGVKPPVRGKLLVRGIHCLEYEDFADMPETIKAAKDWYENIGRRLNWNLLPDKTISIIRPGVE